MGRVLMLTRMHPPAGQIADPRYPIGPYRESETGGGRNQALADIAVFPSRFAASLTGLRSSQLDTPYRDGGWTVRLLAHHLADSHMNAYVRLRLALTEDWPTIKPYHEALWAELADARTLPVEPSLDILTALHLRWTALLGSLEEADWQRGYVHPVNRRTTIEGMTALYSWHGRHHTAHVLALRERMGW